MNSMKSHNERAWNSRGTPPLAPVAKGDKGKFSLTVYIIVSAIFILLSDTFYTVFLSVWMHGTEKAVTRFALTVAQLALVLWPVFPLMRSGKYFRDYQARILPALPKDANSPFHEIQSVINAVHGIDHKNAELEELRKLREREQNQFFANASHEMRTPMTTMIGWLDLLQEAALGPLTEEQGEAIKAIQASLQRLMVTVNNTIDISKIEVGRMQVDEVEFPADEEIEFIRIQFQPQIAKKHQHMRIELATDLPLVFGDQDKFKQVLTNLVSNAVKYTPDGGTITLRVTPCEHDPDCIVFQVEDTGVGIPKSDMEEGKLFSKFYQVRVKDARIGSGLGLAIVKELVGLMHGSVRVESEVGKGTVFTVTMPGKRIDAE